jgi:hypothetical protein
MITKNTIQRSIAALAVAGAIAGAATTGAQAATPAGHGRTQTRLGRIKPDRPDRSPAAVQQADQPGQRPRGHHDELVDAYGDNEGLPEIGSTMRGNESQGFEVQYKAGGTGIVYAEYDISGSWGQ